MQIDLQKTGVHNLLEQILADNPGAVGKINLSTFDFGPVSVAAGTGGRNTSVTLTMKANQAYEGDQTFSYIRLQVGAAIGAPITSYSYEETTTWSDLLTSISAGLGIKPEEVNFTNLPDVGGLPVVWNGDGTVTHDGSSYTVVSELYGVDAPNAPDFSVTAKAGSYLYIGTVAVDLTFDRPDIATILTVTDLTGFQPGA